jgi:hypothetical protein
LHVKVFDTETFQKEAPKKFIRAELDWYRKREMPGAEKKYKKSMMQKFGVGSFPSVQILKPNGEVIGMTRYRKGGPVKYLEYLDVLIADSAEESVEDVKEKD